MDTYENATVVKRSRYNNLAMVQFGAVLMVIVGQEMDLLQMSRISVLGIDIYNLGLRILFLVSGYLMCGSYLRTKDVRKYLEKRVDRLYPPLVFCLFVTVVLLRFFTTAESKEYFYSVALYLVDNLVLCPRYDLAGVFADNLYPINVNGVLWTIPIGMMCCIFLIPILEVIKFFGKKSATITKYMSYEFLLVLSILEAVRQMKYAGQSWLFWGTDWTFMPSLSVWFLTGAFFCGFKLRRFCNWQVGGLLAIVYVCMPPFIQTVLAPFVVGYLVFCFGLAEEPLFYNIFKRNICYGMYLFAFPVQQAVISVFLKNHWKINLYFVLLLSILITLLFAEITYWGIEDENSLWKRLNKQEDSQANGESEKGDINDNLRVAYKK